MNKRLTTALTVRMLCVVLGCLWASTAAVAEQVPLYHVHEVTFSGPTYGPADTPAVDVNLVTVWVHESGQPALKIYGFWDGDGKGQAQGNVFKVRFCPTKVGKWTLTETISNDSQLKGRHEGDTIACIESDHSGFWLPDPDSKGRWYTRSDGSHPYIVGNTMYSFLSEHSDKGPTGGSIAADIAGNSQYFKKVRFSITGDRYPHPTVKPFLDDSGQPTDDGSFSHRPNPAWFNQRVDRAVRTAFDHDLIADLILNGPDTEDSRSVLAAGGNNGDPTPLLKYIAARYGSYPNVWLCLSNEFDIKTPRYTCAQIAAFGKTLRSFLPYPTPMSVHARPRDWYTELNTDPPWHDHVTLQNKIKKLDVAADFVSNNHPRGANKPVLDDELAYEGKGDGWSEQDVIESHLGAFLGGGYGTTGHKPANKRGHYFFGNFKAEEHTSADNLLWLRRVIDENVTFWKMTPERPSQATKLSIFENVDSQFRALIWPDEQYVLGTDKSRRKIKATLPQAAWRITQYDVVNKTTKVLATNATGTFTFDSPDSRAVMFHFKRAAVPPAYALTILGIGIVTVVVMIALLRMNAFIALITSALVVSMLAPGDLSLRVGRVAGAFGQTAGGIGIVIALAVVIGKCMMDSGAADRIVRSFLRLLGEKRAATALMASGFVLAVPVFFDTVFYLLVPLARSMYRRTGKHYVKYCLAIVGGGVVTHALVPPTPGPLLVADTLGLDIGLLIVVGAVIGVPSAIVGMLFANWSDRRMPIAMRPLQTSVPEPEPIPDSQLPPLLASLLPIALPVLLVSSGTIVSTIAKSAQPGTFVHRLVPITGVLGNVNFAMLLAAAVAVVLLVVKRRLSRARLAKVIEDSLLSGGMIILITAAGGAFGKMLKTAEVGPAIQGLFTSQGRQSAGLMVLVIAAVVAALIKIAQGSTTVAMITVSGMVAGMIGASGSLGYHPVYLATAIGGGALIGSWMNDSGFWVFVKMTGLTEAEGLKTWTPTLAVVGLAAVGVTLLMALAFPLL